MLIKDLIPGQLYILIKTIDLDSRLGIPLNDFQIFEKDSIFMYVNSDHMGRHIFLAPDSKCYAISLKRFR